MMQKMKTILKFGLSCVVTVLILAGCATDWMSRAEKGEKGRPGFAETRAFAEEGFIYGLPIVMNYTVMYEYAIDRNSGQFKAPFNQIKNEARVFTNKDTAVITPNSVTPYSFAGLTCAPSRLSFPCWPPAVTRGK